MEKIKHVVLASKVYEDVLNLLSLVPYKDSAQVISILVNEVKANQDVLGVVNKDKEKE